jgi:NAD(P)-dependent dehydrogenase (short-subunit alcohol dehydrogenase family)
MHPEDDNALNTEEKIWDLTMQINLKGVWWGCKYAILAMRKNPTDTSKGLHVGGSIINTASFVALMGAATPQLACKCSIFLVWINYGRCDIYRHRFQGEPPALSYTEQSRSSCRVQS